MTTVAESAQVGWLLVGVFAWWPVLWVLDRVWPIEEGGAA